MSFNGGFHSNAQYRHESWVFLPVVCGKYSLENIGALVMSLTEKT